MEILQPKIKRDPNFQHTVSPRVDRYGLSFKQRGRVVGFFTMKGNDTLTLLMFIPRLYGPNPLQDFNYHVA